MKYEYLDPAEEAAQFEVVLQRLEMQHVQMEARRMENPREAATVDGQLADLEERIERLRGRRDEAKARKAKGDS